MLHLRPDIVYPERAFVTYPHPGSRYLDTDLIGSKPVRTFLAFNKLSESGTFGDPGLASAEKGRGLFEACAEALADFLRDFLKWPLPEKRR